MRNIIIHTNNNDINIFLVYSFSIDKNHKIKSLQFLVYNQKENMKNKL